MPTAAIWTLGITLAAGLGLACFYLKDQPIRGAARIASIAHGLLGTLGTTLAVIAIRSTTADPAGMGLTAASLLAAALLTAAIIAIAHLRRRRAPGLAVALHATLAVGGFVILLAWARNP